MNILSGRKLHSFFLAIISFYLFSLLGADTFLAYVAAVALPVAMFGGIDVEIDKMLKREPSGAGELLFVAAAGGAWVVLHLVMSLLI